MLKEVIMPQLGLTMTTGTIQKWLKKEGDQVEKGELILEVMTDKVTMEVESFDSGILKKVVAREGEEIPVTQVIAYIGDEKDELPPELIARVTEAKAALPSEAAAAAEPQKELALAEEEEEGRIKASPLARRLAQEKGLDLRLIKGSGPGGRITKEDVLKAAEEKEKRPGKSVV